VHLALAEIASVNLAVIGAVHFMRLDHLIKESPLQLPGIRASSASFWQHGEKQLLLPLPDRPRCRKQSVTRVLSHTGENQSLPISCK